MHDLLVHRRAHRRRIPVVPLERRLRARLAHPPLGQRVDVRRRHARRHHLPQLGENPRHELVHPSQLRNLALRPADNHRASPSALSPPGGVVDHRVELVRHTLRRLRTVHDAERRPLAVVLQHRLRGRADTPSTLAARRPGRRRCAAPVRRRTSRTPSRPTGFGVGAARASRSGGCASRRTSSCSGTATSTTISGPPSALVHELVERPGLRHGARKPVEHEPRLARRASPADPRRSR